MLWLSVLFWKGHVIWHNYTDLSKPLSSNWRPRFFFSLSFRLHWRFSWWQFLPNIIYNNMRKMKKQQSERLKLPLQGKKRLTSVESKTVISHFCDAKHLCQEAYCQHLLTPIRSRATEHVNYLSSSNCRLRKCNSKKIILLLRKEQMDMYWGAN